MSGFMDDFFYPHTVTIEDRIGGGGMGSGFGPARSVRCEVKDEMQQVTDSNSEEAISSSNVTIPLPEHVVEGSRVTVWPGTPRQRSAEVIAVATNSNTPPLQSYLVLSLK